MSGLFDDITPGGGLFDDLIPPPQPTERTATPPSEPATPAFSPVANLVMDSLNGQGPEPDAPRRVIPLDALQDERPPSPAADLGAGPVMRKALARGVSPQGSGTPVGAATKLTGQDRSHVMRMTQDMPADAQMAVLSFVNEAVTSGQMNATEAMLYALENLQEGSTQVPRTGPRGWLGGTKSQPTYNVSTPELPEGFVLD